MRTSTSLATTSFFGIVFCSTAFAQTTTRVNVDSGELEANLGSLQSSVSADGRYVAFESQASNLVPGDTNGVKDIFVRDRQNGTTERVSIDSSGAEGDGASRAPSISDDGRYVSFESESTNLVLGDSNLLADIFVRDRQSATTERASVDSMGVQGNDASGKPWGANGGSWISGNGRYVCFISFATNLVAGDTNGTYDVFVHDLQSGTTERVSVNSTGTQGNASSQVWTECISADGRFVVFDSGATNLVPGDTNGLTDAFVRDRLSGTTERSSLDSGGAQGNNHSTNASISADGRCVAFASVASNFVVGDSNGWTDIFVRDLQNDTTERVSVSSGGVQANQLSGTPVISGDGRYVAFFTVASNLVTGDVNGDEDVIVRDRATGTTQLVSMSSAGAHGDNTSAFPSISRDGRYIVFASDATNLVPADSNGIFDVFIHDRSAAGFTSLCDPGAGGVQACPCSNPPSGAGRGCNNSSGTGGAILSASGVAYLSADSLVFTTSGERPTATSILLQGTTSAAAGIVYGQGIRCVAGSLKRLFQKSAVAGSITVPNFGAGDPTVSARSAAKGDVISAGQSRWYLVFYRDPNVLGGCPAASAFNTTQSGRVLWMP